MNEQLISGPLTTYLPEADPAALAETMVAFANSDGGAIVLGVDDAGRQSYSAIFGEELEGALRAAEQRCRPVIPTGWEQFEVDGGTAFVVRVARSPELHTLDDGRVLIRAGAENRPLTGEQVRLLAASKSTGDFETEAVAGATRADLDEEVIAEYLKKRQSRQRRPIDGKADEVLMQVGALTAEGLPTVAGLLLFGAALRCTTLVHHRSRTAIASPTTALQ